MQSILPLVICIVFFLLSFIDFNYRLKKQRITIIITFIIIENNDVILFFMCRIKSIKQTTLKKNFL